MRQFRAAWDRFAADEAKTIWPQGWKSPKPYIRIVPQPK